MLSGVSNHPLSVSPFLQKVRQMDLAPIAYQLMESKTGPRWTRTQTLRAISQYIAFLYLVDTYPRHQLVPSRTVDQVWHYHILDTVKYAEDCQMLFGRLIHHFPYFGVRSETDEHHQRRAYVLTQVLLRKHFGETWASTETEPADCEPIRLAAEPLSGEMLGYSTQGTDLRSRPGVAIALEELFQVV